MASRSTTQLPISRIRVKPGRRPLDPAHVANMKASFIEIGQRQPISVRPVPDSDPERANYAYELVAGGHRLEAGRQLNWRVIDGIVEDEPELDARIAEVDENLVRRDYTALERVQAVAARMEAFAAKHPDRVTVDEVGQTRAKPGRPKKLPHGDGVSPRAMGFAQDAAQSVGLSVPTIERDLAVYRGIPAGLQAQLLGTAIGSNPGLLRQLANVADKDEQARVAELLLSGQAKSVPDAMAIAAGNTPATQAPVASDETLKAFRKLWAGATPSDREAVLHWLSGKKLPGGYAVTGPANG